MISWEEAIEAYRIDFTNELAAKTLYDYLHHIGLFVVWAKSENLAPDSTLMRDVKRFLIQRGQGGASETTRHHDARAIKYFFTHCYKSELIDRNPLADYKIKRPAKPFVRRPSIDELRALLAAIQRKHDPDCTPNARFMDEKQRRFLVRRDYAMLCGLIELGCRRGELCAIQLEDVDTVKAQVTFRKTKAGQPRTVPFTSSWGKAVADYLKVRPKRVLGALFITREGKPVQGNSLGKYQRGYLDAAGLQRFTLHGIRHHTISAMANKSVKSAQAMAGHGSVATTDLYLHEDAEVVRADHAAVSPLGRILIPKRESVRRPRVI